MHRGALTAKDFVCWACRILDFLITSTVLTLNRVMALTESRLAMLLAMLTKLFSHSLHTDLPAHQSILTRASSALAGFVGGCLPLRRCQPRIPKLQSTISMRSCRAHFPRPGFVVEWHTNGHPLGSNNRRCHRGESRKLYAPRTLHRWLHKLQLSSTLDGDPSCLTPLTYL